MSESQPVLTRDGMLREVLGAALYEHISERAQRTALCPTQFVRQLCESDLAEARVTLCKAANANVFYPASPRESEPTLPKHPHCKVDAAIAQRILFLFFDEKRTVTQIALSFQLGESTIRRVLKAHADAEHVRPSTSAKSHEQKQRYWEKIK